MVQRHSAKCDQQNFQRVYNQRQPAVQEASRALQGVIGIEPGTKIIGHLAVTQWQLPVPPMDSLQKLLERARKSTTLKKAAQQAAPSKDETCSPDDDSEISDDSDGPEDLLWYPLESGEITEDTDEENRSESSDGTDDAEIALFQNIDFGDDETVSDSEARRGIVDDQRSTFNLKRKRTISPPPTRRCQSSTSKKPKIVIDLTESPVRDTDRLQLKALTQQPVAASETESVSNGKLVSPPAHWQTPAHVQQRFKKAPAHWYPSLSMHVVKWIEQPETKTLQTCLSRIELRSTAEDIRRKAGKLHIAIDEKGYGKVRIMRITLPTSAQSTTSASSLLEWLVIEVEYKEGSKPYLGYDTDDDDEKPKRPLSTPQHLQGPPYWLLAFPIEAVTECKVESLKQQASPARPQGRRFRQKPPQESQDIRRTTMVLGHESKVPLLHGRGVDKRFADDFIHACAMGKAEIVLKSSEPVPVEGI